MKSGTMACSLCQGCLVESILTWVNMHTIKIAGEPKKVEKVKKILEQLFALRGYGIWEEKTYRVNYNYNWDEYRFVSDLEKEFKQNNKRPV